MPKHPVPKQKVSKHRTRRRYSAFERKAQSKILDKLNIVDCPSCGGKTLNHFTCQNCGKYKNREVIDMNKKLSKVKKVKV